MITTLCYLEKDNKYLMLHRTKKENDINKNKWLGVGGKLEKNETPEQCLFREVKEETLVKWADQLEVPIERTIAIGDGANDLKMLKRAGLGIAFCAKDIVKKEINLQVDDRDMMKVLDKIGYL